MKTTRRSLLKAGGTGAMFAPLAPSIIKGATLPKSPLPEFSSSRARAVEFGGGTVLVGPPINDGSTALTSSFVWNYWYAQQFVPAPTHAYTIMISYVPGTTQPIVALRHYRTSGGNLVFNVFCQSADGSSYGSVFSSTVLPVDSEFHNISGAINTQTGQVIVRLDKGFMSKDNTLTSSRGVPFQFPAKGNSFLIGGDFSGTGTNTTDVYAGLMAELYFHQCGDPDPTKDYALYVTPRVVNMGGYGFGMVTPNSKWGPLPLGPHGIMPLGLGASIPALCQQGDASFTPPPMGGFKYNFWGAPFIELTGALTDAPISPWDNWP